MSVDEIKNMVLRIAEQSAQRGAGWSQEGVVLREVSEQLREGRMKDARPDLNIEQLILDAWHDLFAEKTLGWGYNLDNPNSPFFHIRKSA